MHESATIKRFEVRSEEGKEEGKRRRERGGELFREGKVTPNDRSIAALTLGDIPRGEEQIPQSACGKWTLEVNVKLSQQIRKLCSSLFLVKV